MNTTPSQPIVGFATTNPHKLRETQQCFDLLCPDLQVVSLIPEVEVEETGQTFAENARIKLQAILEQGVPDHVDYVMTEDAGLIIFTLDGLYDLYPFPGVRSARWFDPPEIQEALLGQIFEGPDYTVINQAILKIMEGRADRRAAYQAHVSCWKRETGEIMDVSGCVCLNVASAPQGENGFGYDPIMIPVEYHKDRTMAQLAPHEKNLISHRYQALHNLISTLTLPCSP